MLLANTISEHNLIVVLVALAIIAVFIWIVKAVR